MKRRNATILLLIVSALLVASVASVAVAKNITCSRSGACNGTNKADHITASDRPQTISARAGNDIVFALGSNDTVKGQGDDDRISGGAGNDTIFGGGGDDVLNDTAGPNSGQPADRDLVHPGSETNQIDVADGDGLDIVCSDPGAEPGGLIRYDGAAGDSIPVAGEDDPAC